MTDEHEKRLSKATLPTGRSLHTPSRPPRPAGREVMPATTRLAALTPRSVTPAVTPEKENDSLRERMRELELELGRVTQALETLRVTVGSQNETAEKQAERIRKLEAANAALIKRNRELGDQLLIEVHNAREATSVVLTHWDRQQTREPVEQAAFDIEVDESATADARAPLTSSMVSAFAKLVTRDESDTDEHVPLRNTQTVGMTRAEPSSMVSSQLPVVGPPSLPHTPRPLSNWRVSGAGRTQPIPGLAASGGTQKKP